MFKKTKVDTDPEQGSVMVQSLEQVEEINQTPVFTGKAFGLFKNDLAGQWEVVIIEYNKDTGEVGNFQTVVAGPDRIYGIERFKIEAMNANLFGDL